jgi:hypothetical protein
MVHCDYVKILLSTNPNKPSKQRGSKQQITRTRGIADFGSDLSYERIPAALLQHIKLLTLNSVCCALYASDRMRSGLVTLVALSRLTKQSPSSNQVAW